MRGVRHTKRNDIRARATIEYRQFDVRARRTLSNDGAAIQRLSGSVWVPRNNSKRYLTDNNDKKIETF